MLEVGQRVYVRDLLFEGYAVIQHIIPGEIFGIQVELEEGDGEGHKIFRVGLDQVKLAEPEYAKVAEITPEMSKTFPHKI